MRKLLATLSLSFALGVSANAQSAEGPFKIGNGVSAPIPISQPEPKYSDEERAAGVAGTVRVKVVVDATGAVASAVVTRPLTAGLDKRAIEAVLQWRFKPAMKDGQAVPVEAYIDVAFHLLERPPAQ